MMGDQWPALPYDSWKDTCATVQMWTQIVGKVALELKPFLNEWWEVAFHPTARGMTTGIIPYGNGSFDVTFDFLGSALYIATNDGQVKSIPLVAQSVADFYKKFLSELEELGINVRIDPHPTEVPHAIPFDQDTEHASYDKEYVRRWHEIQLQTVKVLQRYRSPFVGKSSPIQFFWGSFDLNETRFSGRPAPKPKEGPHFYQVSEDQENVAAGFWPGNPTAAGVELGGAAYYSYIYPAPKGYKDAAVKPAAAHYDEKLGEFILRYEDVHTADDPAQNLLDFFQSSYEAAAKLAGWDLKVLQRS